MFFSKFDCLFDFCLMIGELMFKGNWCWYVVCFLCIIVVIIFFINFMNYVYLFFCWIVVCCDYFISCGRLGFFEVSDLRIVFVWFYWFMFYCGFVLFVVILFECVEISFMVSVFLIDGGWGFICCVIFLLDLCYFN